MKYQKGIIQIVLIIGIVAVLGVIGYLLYSQKMNSLNPTGVYNVQAIPSPYQTQYQQSGQSIAPINSSADLNSASASLDSANTAQIDSHLKALESASAGF